MYEMFLTMIKNNYNNVSGVNVENRIADLKAIYRTIDLIPMKYIISGEITISQTDELQRLIETNAEIISGDRFAIYE